MRWKGLPLTCWMTYGFSQEIQRRIFGINKPCLTDQRDMVKSSNYWNSSSIKRRTGQGWIWSDWAIGLCVIHVFVILNSTENERKAMWWRQMKKLDRDELWMIKILGYVWFMFFLFWTPQRMRERQNDERKKIFF